MNSKQTMTEVRKRMIEAEQRNVWKSANEVISKLSTGESAKPDLNGALITQTLSLYTGVEYFEMERVTSTANKHYVTIKITRANGAIMLQAHLVPNCGHARRERDTDRRIEQIRHIRQPDLSCVRIDKYEPGQWEKILQLHEAERILNEERDVKNSLALRKGGGVSDAERKLALDFGLKIK